MNFGKKFPVVSPCSSACVGVQLVGAPTGDSEPSRASQRVGWPADLAPPLERLCSVCKDIESWLSEDSRRIAVIHARWEGLLNLETMFKHFVVHSANFHVNYFHGLLSIMKHLVNSVGQQIPSLIQNYKAHYRIHKSSLMFRIEIQGRHAFFRQATYVCSRDFNRSTQHVAALFCEPNSGHTLTVCL
jgi:hypothetical protein